MWVPPEASYLTSTDQTIYETKMTSIVHRQKDKNIVRDGNELLHLRESCCRCLSLFLGIRKVDSLLNLFLEVGHHFIEPSLFVGGQFAVSQDL